MMKVFICPECGWIRTVSCSGVQMLPSRLTFVEYSQMSDEQREDYAQSWLFIHGKAKA